MAGKDGGGDHMNGEKAQSAAHKQWRHCPAALLKLRGEVELNLSLLEVSSLPDTSCLASPHHLPLSECSSGSLPL